MVVCLYRGPWNVPQDPYERSRYLAIKSNVGPPDLVLSKCSVQFSSVAQSCQLFATPWTAACQASLSITNSWSLPKLMFIESVMPSNHLILCHSLSSCPQSYPASGSFQMSQLFTSGGQSIGVSASTSVLPMNTQD